MSTRGRGSIGTAFLLRFHGLPQLFFLLKKTVPCLAARSTRWEGFFVVVEKEGTDLEQRKPAFARGAAVLLRFAHVLVVDAPVGVGYSMSEADAGTAHHTDGAPPPENSRSLFSPLSSFSSRFTRFSHLLPLLLGHHACQRFATWRFVLQLGADRGDAQSRRPCRTGSFCSAGSQPS